MVLAQCPALGLRTRLAVSGTGSQGVINVPFVHLRRCDERLLPTVTNIGSTRDKVSPFKRLVSKLRISSWSRENALVWQPVKTNISAKDPHHHGLTLDPGSSSTIVHGSQPLQNALHRLRDYEWRRVSGNGLGYHVGRVIRWLQVDLPSPNPKLSLYMLIGYQGISCTPYSQQPKDFTGFRAFLS